ncbi:MAG TPA: glycosyltransferase family 4 protein, partial [Bacteroidia bacterium]|nr:glycosyltransferase family 4 protein [Bacteroidia bacterium]
LKILQLCLRVPLPPYDGATIAMYNLAESLTASGAAVKMLSFNTKKHFMDANSIDAALLDKYKLETVFLDASVNAWDAFTNLFKPNESYNIVRFDSAAFHQKLKEILQSETFDFILFEGLFLSPYLQTVRTFSKAKCILRAHNVEWLIWKRLAAATTNSLKKIYLHFLSGRLKRYENNIINNFDAIVAISEQDKNLFLRDGCNIPIEVAPTGMNTAKYNNIEQMDADSLSLFHLGSMDWLPNIEAVDWLLKDIWPMIQQKSNKVHLFLAGKNMNPKYFNIKSENLIVAGEIKDALKFMENKQIMVVPLLSGGGIRIKILEGLAAGKVIVSTSTGAEGINYSDKKNILIADTPEDFTKTILSLLNNPNLLNNIAREAQILARTQYDNILIGKKLAGFLKTI